MKVIALILAVYIHETLFDASYKLVRLNGPRQVQAAPEKRLPVQTKRMRFYNKWFDSIIEDLK